VYYYFTDLALAQGDLDAAAGHLEKAWDALGDSPDPLHRAHLEYASGRLALAREEWEDAARHLEAAMWTKEIEDTDLFPEVCVHRAWVAQAVGDAEKAGELLQHLLELTEQCPFIYPRILGNRVAYTVYGLRRDEKGREAALNRLREELNRVDQGLADAKLRESFFARWGEYLDQAGAGGV
jgi:tetratricopeptide (TPR) repeat protein